MTRHKQKTAPGRNLRLADQIQKDLAIIIQREIDMSRAGLITLSGIELTADYAHAKVYFTVLGAEPEVAAKLLNEKAGWFLFTVVQTAAYSYGPEFAIFSRPSAQAWHCDVSAD